MPRYRYIARSPTGERMEGFAEAADRPTLLRRLRSGGLVPIAVEDLNARAASRAPDRSPASHPRFFSLRRLPRAMRPSDLAMFARELSDLMGAGMTLGRALQTLARRRDTGVAGDLHSTLRDEILRGASLSEALEARAGVFPALFINMVRAGETGGRLAETLRRLSEHYERAASAREKVVSALAYPAFVLVAAIGTVIFAMTFVVPRFSAIFRELGGALPAPTRALIAISRAAVRHGPWVALVLTALVWAAARSLRHPTTRRRAEAGLLRMPIVGPIMRAGAFGRFAHTLGSLLANGIPVLQALSIAETTVGHAVIAEAVRQARERVTDGATISGPLAEGGLFPPDLTDMLAIGEETGDLPSALERIAQRYDAELDRRLRAMTTLIGPALILLVAVIIGFIAISLLTAVFEMTSGLKVR